MAPTDKPTRSGTWIVFTLLLIGLIGATLSWTYWRGVMRRSFPVTTQPATQPADSGGAGDSGGEGAGAVAWNPKIARSELDAVRARFDKDAGLGDLRPILTDARHLVERYPRYAEARNLYGQILLFDKQLEPAYEQFQRSLEIDRQQAEVQFMAGTVADQLDRTDDALRRYGAAVDLAPREARYRVYLAKTYLKTNDAARARETLLEALNLDSSNYEAYAVLSGVYAQENKLSLALVEIDKAIHHIPSSQRAMQARYILRRSALLRRDNRPEEALQALDALTPDERADTAALQDTATCWSMLGRFDRAAGVYEAAMAEAPFNWELAVEAARWRIKAGDKAGAEKDIDVIRRLNPRASAIVDLEKQVGK